MDLAKYAVNFFNRKKFNHSISWLAFWDKKTVLPDQLYLAPFARLMNCKVGRYTRIKPGCVFKNATLGNYCSIANDVMIGIGQHPTNLLSTNSIFYKPGIHARFAQHIEYEEEPYTTIGHDVWIGNGALVMDGVTIGNGAIVAARAVVTKNVPPYAIVGGIPAKVIKFRYDDETISLLQRWQWWNLSDDFIDHIKSLFVDSDINAEKIRKVMKLATKQ